MCLCLCSVVFFFKQKTAYEMRISDWSSDVCSSDLQNRSFGPTGPIRFEWIDDGEAARHEAVLHVFGQEHCAAGFRCGGDDDRIPKLQLVVDDEIRRSEEHTSELQSLMRISYAVFCLKKKKKINTKTTIPHSKTIKRHMHNTNKLRYAN